MFRSTVKSKLEIAVWTWKLISAVWAELLLDGQLRVFTESQCTKLFQLDCKCKSVCTDVIGVEVLHRQYSSLLRELKALKRRYQSDDSSVAGSQDGADFRRLRLDNLLGRTRCHQLCKPTVISCISTQQHATQHDHMSHRSCWLGNVFACTCCTEGMQHLSSLTYETLMLSASLYRSESGKSSMCNSSVDYGLIVTVPVGWQSLYAALVTSLAGPCIDDSPPCQGSPPQRASPLRHRAAPSSYKAKQQLPTSRRRMAGQKAQEQLTDDAVSSIESPLTSMVNAVLGNRSDSDLC